MNDFYSSEDARIESERHRREIADILDALGDKISHGVQQAEHQINKPVNFIRDYPFIAIAVGVGVGFLLAGSAARQKTKKAHRVDPRVLQELERAYLEGRVDERQNRPTRMLDDWEGSGRALGSRSRDFSLAGVLFDVGKPLLRGLTAGLGSLLGSRLRRD